MVNEERLRMMIHLAEYENGEGKNNLKIRRYYRNDYLALNLIKTFFLTTIAYVLVIGLIAVSDLDYFLNNLTKMDFRVVMSWLIVGYAVMMIIYLGISFFRSAVRYREARKSVRRYEDELLILDRLGRREKE